MSNNCFVNEVRKEFSETSQASRVLAEFTDKARALMGMSLPDYALALSMGGFQWEVGQFTLSTGYVMINGIRVAVIIPSITQTSEELPPEEKALSFVLDALKENPERKLGTSRDPRGLAAGQAELPSAL